MAPGMRVLHVIASLGAGSGGPTAALRGLAPAQAAQGDSVTVLSVNLDGPPWQPAALAPGRLTLRQAGVTWEYFPGRFPRRWLRSPALAAALPAAVAAADAIEIHGLYHHPLIAAARTCRRLGKPYVLRPLGILDPVIQRRRRWRKQLAGLLGGRALLRGAALIHCTSEAEAAIARPWIGDRPVAVVPHGVTPAPPPDAAELARARALWLGEAAGPVLLFLGRLTPKKGLGTLVATLPPLAARWPGLRLLVAGKDEGEAAPAAALAARLGIGRHIVFAGQLDAAAKGAALALANLFVLPSQSENFGLAVVEALAAGVPAVIAPGVAIAAELAASGAALVVPAEPAALADALARLLAAPEQQAALAAAGRRAAAGYSWERAAATLSGHYARLAAR
jgi:glycosyltransferase involved in cell wall biosynthesis